MGVLELRDRPHPDLFRLRRLDDGPHRALLSRAPIPVAIKELPEEPLPANLEAAAYYVVAEAVANVGKYAHASGATVSISRSNGAATVSVSDDGVGGADPAGGSGLRGLAARVEALNGHLDIDSEPGRGTRITAEIPYRARCSSA